jgi:hypothetical protein
LQCQEVKKEFTILPEDVNKEFTKLPGEVSKDFSKDTSIWKRGRKKLMLIQFLGKTA